MGLRTDPQGEHTLRIVVTEQGGGTASREVTFNTIRFNTEFISDPADVVTAGASIESPVDGLLVITGAEVMGETVDIELLWDTGSRQFLIDNITPDGTVKVRTDPQRAGRQRPHRRSRQQCFRYRRGLRPGRPDRRPFLVAGIRPFGQACAGQQRPVAQ